jgi:hypothetical protein
MSDDQMAAAIEQATEHLHAAAYLARGAPVEPGVIYTRCGAIVNLLSKLKTLTAFLCDQIDRAEQTHSLVTEDGSPVVEHTDTARSLVLRAAADVDDAYRLANSARSELSPLKISG